MYRKSQTREFFLKRFKKANIFEAAEIAAQELYEPRLKSYYDFYPVPIDVEAIANRLGISIIYVDQLQDNRYGMLSFDKNSYSIKIRSNCTDTKKRMTIAHELGHLFFREENNHLVDVINELELQEEERICKLIASNLLMPKGHIRSLMKRINETLMTEDTPWFIFRELTEVARKCEISIPSLIIRLNQVYSSIEPSIFIFCSQHFENKFTFNDIRLRIWSSGSTGSLRSFRTWYNKSIESIGSESVTLLFDLWKDKKEHESSLPGVFALNVNSQLCRATKDSMNWQVEDIVLSSIDREKWTNRKIKLLTSSCLFSKKDWDENDIYLVTICRPNDNDLSNNDKMEFKFE